MLDPVYVNNVTAYYDYGKAQKREHFANNFGTALGVGTLASAPYAVKYIVTKAPIKSGRVAVKTGQFIEKAISYAKENAPKVLDKIKSNKYGEKAVSYIGKAFNKAKDFTAKHDTLNKVVTKVGEYADKFSKLSAGKKGKYALIAAGTALLAAGAVKLFKNHYENKGAINQKYQDMNVMNAIL